MDRHSDQGRGERPRCERARPTRRFLVAAIGALSILAACSEDPPSPGESTTPPIGTSGSSGGTIAGRSAIAGAPAVVPVAGNRSTPATPVSAAGAPAAPSAAAGAAAPPPMGQPPALPGAAAGSGSTPPAPGGATPPPAGPPIGTGTTCLQPGDGQYNNPGPYKVSQMTVDLGMIQAEQNSGMFTIYYPDPLEAECPHPIVAWGNGTGVTGSGTYTFLNSNAASWGMVVIESQEDNTGSGAFHKAGLDYLIKQNDDPGSMFHQKLSPRAGVSGHSQGGFGASMGSSHPNVVTAVLVGAQAIATAKVSMLILTGTEDIVMNPEALATNAQGPMFVGNWEGGDHVTTETVAGTLSGDKGTLQFTRLYAAWFRCMLADDPVACQMFKGGAPGNCGICKDPGWHSLTSKNL